MARSDEEPLLARRLRDRSRRATAMPTLKLEPETFSSSAMLSNRGYLRSFQEFFIARLTPLVVSSHGWQNFLAETCSVRMKSQPIFLSKIVAEGVHVQSAVSALELAARTSTGPVSRFDRGARSLGFMQTCRVGSSRPAATVRCATRTSTAEVRRCRRRRGTRATSPHTNLCSSQEATPRACMAPLISDKEVGRLRSSRPTLPDNDDTSTRSRTGSILASRRGSSD